MPNFQKAGLYTTPFGVNEFLRSTHGIKEESRTFACASMPRNAQSGTPNMRVLQPGTVLAKITSGPNAGKTGPFQAAGTAEVQTVTKGTGTYTGGTYALAATGSSNALDTITVPVADTAAQLQTLIQAMPAYAAYVPTVTGGPLGSAALVVTFGGGDLDADVPLLILDVTNVAGQGGAGTVTTGTAGLPGSQDGRSTLANIVGINKTASPWRLIYEDIEVASIYECAAVQGWCIEFNAAGQPVPLSNTTAAAMQRGGAAGKSVDISFH